MLPTREQILEQFPALEWIKHPDYPRVTTFPFLVRWPHAPLTLETARARITVDAVHYFYQKETPSLKTAPLQFQKDSLRLWYQMDGRGILQNMTRNTFGTARPGLLGIMEQGERHSYLHQQGTFEAALIDFQIHAAGAARFFFNSEIEGKVTLNEQERRYCENCLFDLFRVVSTRREWYGLAAFSRLAELLIIPFKKACLELRDEQFPRNKQARIVKKCIAFMKDNYRTIQHQHAIEKETGFNINYLNVLFKKETGKTLYRVLTGIRLERAQYLLVQTDTPVVDIARQVGYPNANSFSRLFKKEFGDAPRLYRIKNTTPQGE